ncbi:MAG TPA: hypothetical protein VGN57_19670 [Pirellulaceae bacterium]|nr:hypothetical protein [Pirellulaceae bacterium]
MAESNNPFSEEAPAPNPYRAPEYFEQPTAVAELDPWQRLEAANILRKFRGCSTALGVMLCLGGLLSLGVTGLAVSAAATQPDLPPVAYLFGSLLVVTTGVYLALGIGALFRQVWAAWGAAALGALGIALDFAFGNFSACSSVLAIIVIVLALTIVNFARRLKTAGIPLHAKL